MEMSNLSDLVIQLAKENAKHELLDYLRRALERGESLQAVIKQLEAIKIGN